MNRQVGQWKMIKSLKQRQEFSIQHRGKGVGLRRSHTAWVSTPSFSLLLSARGEHPDYQKIQAQRKELLSVSEMELSQGYLQFGRGLKSDTHASLQRPTQVGTHKVTSLGSLGAPSATPVPAPEKPCLTSHLTTCS